MMRNNKQFNKTLTGKSGKDLVSLMREKGSVVQSQHYIAPSGETELILFNYWKDLLGHNNFGVQDDFFQLGGNSIKAIQVLSRISTHFLIDITLTDIFLQPTIAQIALLIDARKSGVSAVRSLIEVKERPENIPLSFGQERLWFIDRVEGSIPYHVPAVLRFNGVLNQAAMAHALRQIIVRHEVLRTVIEEKEGVAFQRITSQENWQLAIIDGTGYTKDLDGLRKCIQQLIKEPFDLSKDSMLRAALISITKTDQVLVVTLHHIASDAWSLAILVKEFMELYNSFDEGIAIQLPPLELQYADYALWQKQDGQTIQLEKNLEYWKVKLDGVAPLQLPVDFTRPVNRTTNGGAVDFIIDKELSEQLADFAHEQGTTLFMVLLTTFKVLLHRYSGQRDICVGTSIANRNRHELEGLIGFFVNTLALRTDVSGDISFIKLLREVESTTLAAFEHQDVPFEKVVEVVDTERDASTSPLFQVMLVMPNTPDVKQLKLKGVEIVAEAFLHNTSKYDITYFIAETANGLQASVEYNIDLFKADTIQKMSVHFENLLRAVVNNPQEKTGLLPMVTAEEQQQLLEACNDSAVEYPTQKSIVDLFEVQVANTPENAAIVFEEETLSYRQLNEKANQLAQYLKSKGITKDSLVPFYVERSASMVVALLGIMKSGAAYVPIDIDFPQDRISYMLEDTGATIIVSSINCGGNLAVKAGVEIIEIENLTDQSIANLNDKPSANQLAYVIYTSGSTGKPKGVMIEHQSLADYYYGLNKYTQIGQSKTFALVSTIATDLGNTVIYAALLSGGTLHLFTKESVSNIEYLHNYFSTNRIDCLKIVPSHWKALSMEERLLVPAKLLVLGGEALRSEVVENIFASHPACKVVNHYGPTETTIGKLLHVVDSTKTYARTIPIGKPFSNTQVYILSKDMQLCPVGVPGQLYVAGDGVARGYHNNAKLTNEKFIADPFATQPGSKMYGTGDMVKWLTDGNIEFIGRVDDQVKIRGYRIELAEIEGVLLQSSLVSEAVVLAKEDKQGNKRLVGYVVPVGDYDKEGVIEYMKEKLPDYMIPATLMELESLPLTANGKIDRKALPDPETSSLQSNTFTAPRTDAETALADIWQELLDIESVGVHDNFFELGGDSIITIQLVSRARRAGYELQVGDVFTYQTIARLSALLDHRSNSSTTVSGEQFLLEGASGLLPVQQWYFEKEPAEPSHFNQTMLLRIDKGVTEALLKRAFEQLTAHHDSLRFKYYKKDGAWYQVYEHQSEISRVVVEDLRSLSADTLSELITECSDRHQKSLNIEKGELVRLVLMLTPVSEDTNRLLIAVHHLAIDGVSWRIFLEDLEFLLTGFKNGSTTELGNKTSSVRQWYEALVKYSQSNNVLAQKKYWDKVVQNYRELPVDIVYTEPVSVKDITHHTMRLDTVQTRLLTHDVPRVYHTEINDILLAALAKTFTEFAGTDKVIIGMEGHGRESIEDGIDTSRTVGWFTTHYPVLLEVNTSKGEDDLIKNIKEQLRQVPDKGLGFGVLKYINKEELYEGNSSWDVMYNYLGQADNVFNTGQWLSMATEAAGADRSPEYVVSEKLVLNGMIQNGELVFHWSYSDKQYEKQTIIALVNKFQANLESLIEHCINQQKNEGVVFTPSDYGLGKEISYSELDTFLKQSFNGQPVNKSLERMYRLSGLQQGMLFHGLYDGDGSGYLNQFWCDLINPNLDALNNSWKHIMRSHSILRSAFYPDAFLIPVQAVHKEVNLPIEIIDYRHLGEAEQTVAIKEFEQADKAKGFDFTKAPLMRISLLRLDDNRYRMLWSAHHILFDGWSRSILMGNFLKIYDSLVSGNPLPVMVDDQYEDYIQYIELINKEDERVYWKKYLQRIEHSSLLPFIGTTSERNKGLGIYKSVLLDIDKTVTQKIGDFAQRHRLTINTLVQGIWAYLLHRYTVSNDIVYGVIVSGRPDDLPQVEQRVGMFINVIPLHTTLKEEETFVQWVTNIQQDQVTSRNYQYTPLHQIQAWTGLQGDLFDSLLVFENYPVSKVMKAMNWNLQIENVRVNEQTNYPLTLMVSSTDEINIDFGYNSSLLCDTHVYAIKDHFQHVLMQVIENENTQVKEIEILTDNEKNQLLVQLNNTVTDYPKDKSLVDLFEEQVLKTPDNEAVVFENNVLSYHQLNKRSNQLARYLISKGVAKETLVPLCIERGVEMIVGLLGILKAGASYVPVDPEYPEDRITYMLEDTGATIVLSSRESKSKITGVEKLDIIELDSDWAQISEQSTANLQLTTDPHQLAYVIYTSGSTGKPKGVMIEHTSVVNLLMSIAKEVDFKPCSVFMSVTTFSFDICYLELYMPLLLGGKLVVVPRDVAMDGFKLAANIASVQPTHMQGTPSTWQLLMDAAWQNEEAIKMLVGGEALKEDLKSTLIEKGDVWNVYGPTETTIWSTIHKLSAHEKVLIGAPIANTTIQIVNTEGQLVPVGVSGEILIGGVGLARGYYKRPDLTTEKFIQDKFSTTPGAKMYRTGDLGRWLPGGKIECLGRTDEQVKIRGYRIELGEIETVLQQTGLVRQSVVLAREDKQGNKRLIGYIVPESNFDKQAMLAQLNNKLPVYMVPALWMELESLPLTPNGKIDKKVLPDPDASELITNEYVAPRNDVETKLAIIWQELLQVERVGVHDNFFELGGHSLLAMRLVSLVRKELGVELSIRDLFFHSTIMSLALHLQQQTNQTLLPSIELLQRPEHIPLSFSQERLWFIDRLEGSVQYHIPSVLRLQGNLNEEALLHTLKNIVKRHEVLRTVFREQDGHPYQHIIDPDQWQLNRIEGSIYQQDPEALLLFIDTLKNEPFDLSTDYMFRVHLISLSEASHVLVVIMHHIASDGWSFSVLVKEVVELYNAYDQNRVPQLPPLAIQYADFALWQRGILEGDVLNKKLGYWKTKLQDVAVLSLPTDYSRPLVQSTRGAMVNLSIDKNLLLQLKAFSRKQDCTLFMTLLATFKVLLFRYSGQNDICVGSAIAGRQSDELDALIGFFVNTMALRDTVNSDASFVTLLQQVRKTTLDAYENQEVPFEKVVDAMVGERSLGTDPLVQVMFSLLNTPDLPVLLLGEASLSHDKHEDNTALFEIWVNIVETPNGLNGYIKYSTDLYSRSTMERFMSHYEKLLSSVVRYPQQKIAELEMFSLAERDQLLVTFNDTAKAYPNEKSIVALFEKQVLQTPGNIALIFEDQHFTYSELNEQANQVAHFLSGKGISKESLVPICFDRSPDLIIAILGILKAGGAYVPIDPEYPAERIKYMLEDTGAPVILTSQQNKLLQKWGGEIAVIAIEDERVSIQNEPVTNLQIEIEPHSLAYIIYTSGSTGNPKGVMIEHGNVVSLVTGIDYLTLTEKDVLLSTGSPSFDATTIEYWGMLLNGGSLVLCTENTLLDYELLKKEIRGRQVTKMWFTSSWFNQLVEYDITIFKTLQTILVGGEKLSAGHIQKLRQTYPSVEIINGYGPTENTTFSLTYKVNEINIDNDIPIGRPLNNRSAFIVDGFGLLVPVGVPGEIWLGGAGLARGYLNRPDLTAEKFILSPFNNNKGSRLYKTGDLGKWLPNGTISYLKRLDDQVKVRGYRIELGEIETAMNKLQLVNSCCVVIKKDADTTNRMVGYFLPERELVKNKERELYTRLIESWKDLYETEYAKTELAENIDPEFNIIGWNDSFTGQPIPAEQMQEWLQDIVHVIMAEKALHVLEIGSGTGLIYYQLAGKIKKYIGTDFSRSSVNQVSDQISKGLRDYGPTELQVCAAHEVSLKKGELIDTILLNSIVQYFPGEDYMTGVIDNCIHFLNGKGRIIIGDVRDNRLLQLFKGRLQLEKLQESVSIKDFKWILDQEILKEEELCFSPDYFYRLQILYPEINHIEIKWKQGDSINELTLYRFTVIMYVGMEAEGIQPEWQNLQEFDDAAKIITRLQQGKYIALKEVPNPRLWQERLLHDGLQDKSLRTVGDLVNSISKKDIEAVKVNEIIREVLASGFHCRFLLDADPLKINLVFEPDNSNSFIQLPYSEQAKKSTTQSTNIPLFTDISAIFQKEIRELLQQTLPDYMVPPEIIAIDHLPLTNNGKVDRAFLSRQEDRGHGNKYNYTAPRNDTEKLLANIWQDLLGIEAVSIHDNFFEIGGHSLMASRVISAIRRQLEAEVSIRDIFLHATIASLADHLSVQSGITAIPAIEVLPRPSRIPLSFSQERLWFIDQLEGSVSYNSPTILRLKGKLNKDALHHALKNIVERHEVLRTVFLEADGKPYQIIKDQQDWQLNFIDGQAYKEDKAGLQDVIVKLVSAPFNLSKDYMVRAHLIELDQEDYVLVLTMHHIASDAWSLSILVKEVVEFYSSFAENRTAQLPVLELQYADYAIWQRNYLQGEIFNNKLQYWKGKLNSNEALQLPTDFPRPVAGSTRGASMRFEISKELTAKIQALNQAEGATMFMTLLAAFKVLLHRYSRQSDISVGTSIANRPQNAVEGLVGFFVNTLTLRTEVNSELGFTGLLQEVRATTLEAYQHQDVPFEKVVEAVVTERDMSRSPLFQVMLVFLNTPETTGLRLGEMELSRQDFEARISKFDITYFFTETPEGLVGSVDYSTALYKAATIQRMLEHYKVLLNAIVTTPHEKIGLLPMLTKQEERQLLAGINESEVFFPTGKSVVDLFEEQVSQKPANIAVVFEDEQISYNELNKRSNQLAHYLLSLGIKKDTLVPLYIERSASMLVGMLGIMKAGAAYVPIDTDFPQERISYMLKDSGATLIVSSNACSKKLSSAGSASIVAVDGDQLLHQPTTNPSPKPSGSQLAYVIYTSGSTGKPKGVMIEHGSLVDYYAGLNKHTQIDQCSSFALVSTMATDLGNTVIFGSLLSGGSLHVFSKESVSNIEYLHHYFSRYSIDCLKIVPSHWKALSSGDHLLLPKKLLVFGGEALQSEQVEAIHLSGSACRIVNHYGPTETTIGKLLHEIVPGNSYNKTIPIGKPFSNTRVYILSKEMQLCPTGVAGQLYISGEGLARGYFNNAELTKEKFIPEIFAKGADKKMYGTGDLVKWLADGNIEFLGRLDDQVKIRGYRIEPGEIESVLQQDAQVSQAVVLAMDDKQGNKRLVAYIVVTADFDKEVLVDNLEGKLPGYMIPTVWVELENLPLTANGKVDRKALPDPDVAEVLSDQFIAPRNETEAKLAEIWEDVLEVAQVGIHDDFFELGGHSLLAVRLVSAIRKAFAVEMPIGDIFDFPTVALLSGSLSDKADSTVLPTVEKIIPRPGQIPLSFSQERLWFIDQLEGSVQYHVPAVLKLTGRLNKEALEFGLQNTVNRHEILRTVYRVANGEPYQFIKDGGDWQLHFVDGRAYLNDGDGLQNYIQGLINEAYQLSEDYMLRATLIRLADDEHTLVVTLHHIASDGWSRSVLVNDFTTYYKAYDEGRPANLPVLPVQYADYSIWQRKYLEGEVLNRKITYWKQQLMGVSALQLPTDYPRPAIQTNKGAIAGFDLDKPLLDQLYSLSKQNGTTLFMTLLAAFKVLLYRYSGQQDICVGTPIAGRQQQEVEGLIGFFVNTLALRTGVNGDDSFVELLKQVRAVTLAAYENQEAPFEKVVEAIVKDRDMSRSPVFQVMFVLRNTPEVPELIMKEVRLSRAHYDHTTALFDLTFFITENENGLHGAVEYSTDLFNYETISRMMGHFTQLLYSVVATPQQKISELGLLSRLEENQLLVEFNDTYTDYPKHQTIISLFEEQSALTPDNIAIEFEGEQITYRELNSRSNQLAHYLQKKGIKGDKLVPLCVERSIEMIISVLGILKTGAAYVPLDPEYPEERLQYMLEDTKAKLLISSKEHILKLHGKAGLEIIEIKEDWPLICQELTDNLNIVPDPGYLAYVLYTSGSTGRPKGVRMPASGLVNLLSWQQKQFTNKKRRVLQFASLNFDVSFQEIFSTLCYGGELFLINSNRRKDIVGLLDDLGKYRITHLFIPYIVLQNLAEFILPLSCDASSLEEIIVAGEQLKLTDNIQALIIKHKIKLVNQYGPTEAHVVSSYVVDSNSDLIILPPIGRPIDNTTLYILGDNNQLAPIGVPGELNIGGVQVAHGYLNLPELTAEKFVNDPFSKQPGKRMYKTGDLARWMPDGNIAYLGRKDDQVKVRGYRIELGEIESVLQDSGMIKQVVVLAKEDNAGNKRLVGYLVPADTFDKQAIIAHLRSQLPEYMVPQLWVELDKLPLTPNGKLDKKALPEVDANKLEGRSYEAPRTELEEKLTEIWKELLQVERIGINDNFFELGGHSLLAMRAIAAIKNTFEVELPVKTFFELITIERVANFIKVNQDDFSVELDDYDEIKL